MKFKGHLDTCSDGAIFQIGKQLVYLGRLTEVGQGEYDTTVALSHVRHLTPGTEVHIIDNEDVADLYTEWQ